MWSFLAIVACVLVSLAILARAVVAMATSMRRLSNAQRATASHLADRVGLLRARSAALQLAVGAHLPVKRVTSQTDQLEK
jgi:hypothetical protein